MLKCVSALALSAALFAGTTGTTMLVAVGQAQAEMAAPQTKSKSKSEMTGAERRKKCSAEWKEAKAAGKTGNTKWPKFYSDCNKRLKGA